MAAPLITVLMPVYNAEKYLRDAIQSILNQTLANFEFLIINDGSTDASLEIINSFSDDRIRLIHNEKNSGITAALNMGIDLATAELIARMDADDISYPQRLQKQYDYFSNHADCCLLSTAARVVTADKGQVRIDNFTDIFYYYNLNFICWIYHSTVMYRRSSVLAAGKYRVPYAEDFDLWWKMSRNYKIGHLNEVLLDYRLSEESLSTVFKKQEYEDAQHEQVLRNIRYYTGKDFQLTYNEVECLRHNFDPLLQENSYKAISRFFKKLDQLNNSIAKRKNVNLITTDIIRAAHYKREFIIDYYLSHLAFKKAICLLIEIVPFNKLYLYIYRHLKKNAWFNYNISNPNASKPGIS